MFNLRTSANKKMGTHNVHVATAITINVFFGHKKRYDWGRFEVLIS